MVRSRGGDADIVDNEAALRPLREGPDVRNRSDSGHDAVEPAVGGERHRERLPARNRTFNGCERASEQQGRCKDDGGTSVLFQHEPGGSTHDQHLRQRPHGFGDQHEGFVAALDHLLLAPRILRSLSDQAHGAVEHSHRPDHVEVADGRAEPSLAPRQRAGRPRQRCFREPVFDKPETQQEEHAEHADHAQQGMHQEENAEKERCPERIEQGRAGA